MGRQEIRGVCGGKMERKERKKKRLGRGVDSHGNQYRFQRQAERVPHASPVTGKSPVNARQQSMRSRKYAKKNPSNKKIGDVSYNGFPNLSGTLWTFYTSGSYTLRIPS